MPSAVKYQGLTFITEYSVEMPVFLGCRLSASGDNFSAQLAQGTRGLPSPSPTEIAGDWRDIVAGREFACAANRDGKVSCWGNNSHGQLGGVSSGTIVMAPMLVAHLPPVQTISAGDTHMCAVAAVSPYTSYCWGGNRKGKLGNGSTNDARIPQLVKRDGLAQMSAGWHHTCGVHSSGDLYCWGENESGELGLGFRHENAYSTPIKIGTQSWTDVSVGYSTTCGVSGSKAYCWGSNKQGALGIGSVEDRYKPTLVVVDSDLVTIRTAYHTTCAIDKAGSMYCWGDGSEGQIGDGAFISKSSPTPVATSELIVSVDVGNGFVCALSKEETLLCWGSNRRGQLGLGPDAGAASYPTPTRVADACAGLAVGTDSSYALRRGEIPPPPRPRLYK